MDIISDYRCFEGRQQRFSHRSQVLNCGMSFSIYLPPRATRENVPVLFWLSGLTCNDENFVHKAGAQRYAAEHGFAIVTPDTSPRGPDVPDDPEGAWDFGLGAGFYLNATAEPWCRHYNMYDYVTEELPALIGDHFPVEIALCSIFGHSMGGHGALVAALRNPDRYRSVSAFAPIVAPTQCPWGDKAFINYLGDNRELWRTYDCCELIRERADQLPMLVDQGESDQFLQEQLKTGLLEQACEETGYQATIRRQPGYDHSYFFIASFIGSHIEFHGHELGKAS